MRKVLNFHDYKRLRKMSYNDLCRWAEELYKNAFLDGMDKAEEGIITISADDFKACAESVKGIGEKRADEIIERLKEYELQQTKHETDTDLQQIDEPAGSDTAG